jgi:hypothetical protein
MTKQITKAQFLSETIEENFFQEHAELFAHFNVKAFMESLSAYLGLNYSLDELRAAPTTPGAYRKILALSTITLLNRDAVTPLTDLNEAAEKDLATLRTETGVDLELVPVPAPPQATAEELLADEVRRDWKNLSSDQIRKKRNGSRAYGLMLDRLANDGSLDSQITSLRIAGS